MPPNSRPTRIEFAPTDRIYEHPDLLEEFMRRICELEPHEYVLSDETLLTDMDVVDAARLFRAVRDIYGIDVPQGKRPAVPLASYQPNRG